MSQGFYFVLGVLLFVLNMVFVGINIRSGNYGMAGFNFAAGILVLFTCVILPSYRY